MALYAFDGTGNDSSAPDDQRDTKKDTNVHRFRVLYRGTTEYKDGVGSRFGIIGKYIGGAIGLGAKARIAEQFEALKRNFANGDTVIDVVGYSRGAAIARMFVHRIETSFDLLVDGGGKALARPPPVRFLGLFDTVASFGIPWNARERGFRPDIPELVEHTFHAMALDETRETFGIERCLGNRNKITEVWFRGGHGDIGGNATYVNRHEEVSNEERSDVALKWMVAKAMDCGLPVQPRDEEGERQTDDNKDEAPVTARAEAISIGNAGTLSRRIHLGDLVHHSVERTELTHGIDGRLLRRIDVPTRIEDERLEQSKDCLNWVPPAEAQEAPDNVTGAAANPSLVELSSRRYPFDVLPARTWQSWLELWELKDPVIAEDRLLEFWAPGEADRALAWDVYVELMTRITTRRLDDDEGTDKSALESVYALFPDSRKYMHKHGVGCANTGALLTAYLNEKVREFTAKWHKRSQEEEGRKRSPEEEWNGNFSTSSHEQFREELKTLQPTLQRLAAALSHLADARL